MSSEKYRYYCFDSKGSLYGAEWFEAENDDAAIAQIEAKHPDGLCEVWLGRRLVARFGPERLQA